MPTSTGEMRETLIEAIAAVRSGQLGPNEAKAIAALAMQVNASLQAEINMRQELLEHKQAPGLPALGDMSLGEWAAVIEQAPAQQSAKEVACGMGRARLTWLKPSIKPSPL